jgi:hypothetical protein
MLPNPLQVAYIQTSTKNKHLNINTNFVKVSVFMHLIIVLSFNYVLEVTCVLYSLHHKIIAIP